MATYIQAINRLSEATGIHRGKFALIGRTIREEDESLVSRDPIGRNKATQMTPASLWNLIIAGAAADPVTKSVELVRAYRRAAYQPPLDDLLRGKPARASILPGENLGLDGETLINLLAIPSEQEQLVRREFAGDFRITLTVGEALLATVERPAHGMVDVYSAKVAFGDTTERPSFNLRGVRRPIIPLRRIAHLDFVYFEVAAELWADSLAHGAIYQPSLLDPSDDDPGDESAAPDLAKGQDAAAASDQPAKTELDGSPQLHSAGEKTKIQSPSGLSVGGALIPPWSSENAPVRHRSYADRGSDPTHACAA